MKVIVVVLALVACVIYSSAQNLPCELMPRKFPELDRNLFSIETDLAYSRASIGEMEKNLNRKIHVPSKIVRNEEIEKYFTGLLAKILLHLPKSPNQFPYRVMVFNDPTPNALSVPGGVILISLGMMAITPSDDFLAFLVAHEIGHIELRHDTRRETMRRLMDLQIRVIERKLKYMRRKSKLWRKYNMLLEELKQQRRDLRQLRLEHEVEADYFGIVTGLKAGFNPASMKHYYEKPPHLPYWGWNEWASHPHNFNRVLMYSCLAPSELPAEKTSPEFLSAKIRAKQLLADKKPR